MSVNFTANTNHNNFTMCNEKMSVGSIVYIEETDKRGVREDTLEKILGLGGSKKAWQLQSGKALLLPNMSMDPQGEMAKRNWEKIVEMEVGVSEFLQKHKMLSPNSKWVHVSVPREYEDLAIPIFPIIPAYTSETFESLAERNIFVIDVKNDSSSTWKWKENFLFKSKDERFEIENWDSVLIPLLEDIKKIFLYNIPGSIDSDNIAIVKKGNNKYEARYFGFDFSSKSGSNEFEPREKRFKDYEIKYISEHSTVQTVSRLVKTVMEFEFSDIAPNTAESDKKWDFIKLVVEKYQKIFVEMLQTSAQKWNEEHPQ